VRCNSRCAAAAGALQQTRRCALLSYFSFMVVRSAPSPGARRYGPIVQASAQQKSRVVRCSPPLRGGGQRLEARVGVVEVRLARGRRLGRRQERVRGERERRGRAGHHVRRRHVEELRARAGRAVRDGRKRSRTGGSKRCGVGAGSRPGGRGGGAARRGARLLKHLCQGRCATTRERGAVAADTQAEEPWNKPPQIWPGCDGRAGNLLDHLAMSVCGSG